MWPFSVESIAATCRVRYSYPSPAVSLCRLITPALTGLPSASADSVACDAFGRAPVASDANAT